MLSVRLICIGKLKDLFFRQAMAEYEKRISAFFHLQVIELPEAYLPSNPSHADIQKALRQEAKLILQQTQGLLYPLCIEGKMLSSEQFAETLASAMLSPGKLSFVIGSSHGLADEVKCIGKGISFSRMTFPHTLARVMLAEQIYRAAQIIQNTKYHK